MSRKLRAVTTGPAQISDEEVLARANKKLGECNPPMELGSIESWKVGDFLKIVYLIDTIKPGNKIVPTKKIISPMQVIEPINNAIKIIKTNYPPPEFKSEDVTRRNKEKTIKLLRWIILEGDPSGNGHAPRYLTWLDCLGLPESDGRTPITAGTIAAIAERFHLRGDPFEAFRRVGLPIPDDPTEAVAALFKLTNERGPDEVRFVHDDESEEEMTRIQGVVSEFAQNEPDIEAVNATIKALERLQMKISPPPGTASEELKTRTNKMLTESRDQLNRLHRTIMIHNRRAQERFERENEERMRAFNRYAYLAQDAITTVRVLAEQAIPEIIPQQYERIQFLTMNAAEENLIKAEGETHRDEDRISSLRQEFNEVSILVETARTRLEAHAQASENEKRTKYGYFQEQIETELSNSEKQIEELTGNFESRKHILQEQFTVIKKLQLRTEKQGRVLEEDLRRNGLTGFRPMSEVESDILRLLKKVESVLQEEEEIEHRRKHFVSIRSTIQDKLNSIERKIKSFNYDTLKKIREQIEWLLSIGNFPEEDSASLYQALASLCELRFFPEQQSIDEICNWKIRLISLCNSTRTRLEESAREIEEGKLRDFKLVVDSCRLAMTKASQQYEGIPVETHSRQKALSSIVSTLQSRNQEVVKSNEGLRQLGLDGLVSDTDRDFITEFQHCIEVYSKEMSGLEEHHQNLLNFKSTAMALESKILEISNRRDEYHPQLHERDRRPVLTQFSDEINYWSEKVNSAKTAIDQSSRKYHLSCPDDVEKRRSSLLNSAQQGLAAAYEYSHAG
jgi:ElaB/YqjD/DUF883 family membrane-anchored ribosome-binding protein